MQRPPKRAAASKRYARHHHARAACRQRRRRRIRPGAGGGRWRYRRLRTAVPAPRAPRICRAVAAVWGPAGTCRRCAAGGLPAGLEGAAGVPFREQPVDLAASAGRQCRPDGTAWACGRAGPRQSG
ncbi:hypothetical protein G6F59_017335 [Rhizopus arrhizus]|nr:hypothetical protein G6F59_017335 [Rhizopus arrhizus]